MGPDPCRGCCALVRVDGTFGNLSSGRSCICVRHTGTLGGWRRMAEVSGRCSPGAGRARQKGTRCHSRSRGRRPAGLGCPGCREDGEGEERVALEPSGAGPWRRAGSAPGTGRWQIAARGREAEVRGPGPPPSLPPSPGARCQEQAGEPQTKSRGRSRAGTGARRGRPGGGDAAGAAARGTGEPSPGAGRRGKARAALAGNKRLPLVRGETCPGFGGSGAPCLPVRSSAVPGGSS